MGNEDKIHKEFATQVNQYHAYNLLSDCIWTYTPFGENRNLKTGALLKAKGTMRGFPDFMFCRLENGMAITIFIEFKAGTNNLTKEQKQFFTFFKDAKNVFCYEVRSVKEGIDILLKHNFIK